MASLFTGMSIMGKRIIAKVPNVGNTSTRAKSAMVLPTMQGEGFTDELFARGWCGHTQTQRASLPKPAVTQMASPSRTNPVEARLLDELYSRGWSTSENEVAHLTKGDSDGAVLDELYARGWSTSAQVAHEASGGKNGLDDVVVQELFARGWTWDASTLQVFKKPMVSEMALPSNHEYEDGLLNELFVRGWGSSTQPVHAQSGQGDVKESGPLGEELFVRGW